VLMRSLEDAARKVGVKFLLNFYMDQLIRGEKGRLCRARRLRCGGQAQTFSTLAASVNSLAKPETEVMAARSSWRSMSLSYSTTTSLPQICSKA